MPKSPTCFLVAFVLGLLGCSGAQARTLTAPSCATADVQTAINTASNGDIVAIPSGTCSWTSGVVINGKAITLLGAGSGRIIGQSETTVVAGTGSKTWTTQSGLTIASGQTVRVSRLGDRAQFMEGVVTSYAGTTLTLNVANTRTSGAISSCNNRPCPSNLWLISTQPGTVLINNSSSDLFTITESASASVDWSGIKVAAGTGTGASISINRAANGRPVLIHDCWMESAASSSHLVYSNANRGVIWNCSFDSSPFAMAALAIHQKNGPSNSWATPALWGALDTDGTGAWYIEDSDFHAWLNAVDNDDNGRLVFRHNLMNNAGFGTHGADTSNFGQRYFEIYNTTFVFNGYSNGTTFNLNWWVFARGGTFLITDSVLPKISSQDFGSKLAINMTVMNLQRRAGPHPCWGAGTGGGIEYPAPRQVGMGRVTGTSATDAFAYNGDSEPIYVWNNSGGYNIGTTDFGGTDCVNPDSSASYIMAGRDYFNNGTPKPGYVKYTYPHPLRGAGAVEPPAAPTKLEVR
jgi:hypothetical protein